MQRKFIITLVAAATLAQGCSSRPREFNPKLATPVADPAALEAAAAECRQLLVEGKLDSNGRLGSAGAGVAAGATVGLAGSAAATSAGLYGGMAIASATIFALPVVVLGGAWGMSRIKRAKKEKAIRQAMTGCLKDRGYDVSSWERAKPNKAAPIDPPAN